MDVTIVETAVLRLLDLFLERQRVVFDLLLEIRPDFFTNAPRPTKAYISATQRGAWGPHSEWFYYIHGGGCRIVHVHTGELIEWDSPDLNRFDPNWFTQWVEWWFRREEGDDGTRQVLVAALKQKDGELTRLITDNVAGLERHGFLRYFPGRTNSYERIGQEMAT
jgi:hypothetical protein